MVLIDTVVWIDHFHSNNEHLAMLLENEQVLIHPMVIGELAMGNLANRHQTLEDFAKLPEISVATHQEVIFFVDANRLMGTGISYVDANLLASVIAHSDAELWSRDRRLNEAASKFDVAHRPVGS